MPINVVSNLRIVVALYILYRIVTYIRRRQPRLLSSHDPFKKRPVILIPGLGGSRLYNKQGSLKWCHWHGFFPYMSNTWRDELTVTYNRDTQLFEPDTITPYRTSHWRQDGTTFYPTPDFGGLEGVGNVLNKNFKDSWQFQGLIDWSKRHEVPWTLYGAPYDFRKITSPLVLEEYCRSLRALIQWAYDAHGGQKVILLSHSMGSPLLSQVLQRCTLDWKQQHVKRWISVNGAFGGAGKALRSLLSGDNNGMGYLCDTGCHDWYQPLLQNAAGVLWMLPSPRVFPESMTILKVGSSTYAAQDLCSFLETVNPDAAQAYKDTVVPLLDLRPPEVPMVCVTSTQPGTPLQCTYPDTQLLATQVTMSDERQSYSATGTHVQHMCGDGTVPYLSLMVPQQWLDKGQQQPITFVRLNQENVAHTSILLEPSSVQLIASLI